MLCERMRGYNGCEGAKVAVNLVAKFAGKSQEHLECVYVVDWVGEKECGKREIESGKATRLPRSL
jgi:hypothetical protein